MPKLVPSPNRRRRSVAPSTCCSVEVGECLRVPCSCAGPEARDVAGACSSGPGCAEDELLVASIFWSWTPARRSVHEA